MRARGFALLLGIGIAPALIAAGPGPGTKGPRASESLVIRRSGSLLGVGDGESASTSRQGAAPDPRWTEYWIVELIDDPVATYRGQIPGLAATSPQAIGARKIEPERAEVRLYRSYLARKQDEVLASVDQILARPVEVLRRFDAALNGFVARLSPEEAERVRQLPGVRKVYPNEFHDLLTDVGPQWIGAPGIWNGTATGGRPGTKGEGIIVGVIDSGINSDHPSFADIGGDGYDHTNPNGAGNYRGWCNPGFPVLMSCNDKLIGMWSFPESGNNPEDDDGHGSHTASTAAGNAVTSTLFAPTTSITDEISGVAPHANIIAYDACLVSCPSTALVASVNQAVLDGVDVVNYSISGGSDPYNDAVSQAFLNAAAAGVFTSASAGNNGPGSSTVAHNEPWVQTVAAATHNRKLINRLIAMSGGATAPPPDMTGSSFTSGYGPAPIVYAGSFGDPLCPLGAFPPGTFSGEIVVCDRGGGIARVDKAQSVLNGGAGGFVLANDAASGGSLAQDAYPLPGVHITYADGVALKAWLASGTGHTATIAGTTPDYATANGDILASFSSRGPGASTPDLLKPDVTAPGVGVWAADRNGSPSPEYRFLSGTSMSSPHAAGAGALIRALHPTWTPFMVKSALMLTAVTAVRKEDGTTPATPFDMGAGRVDLSDAGIPGFVLDETFANFAAANPSAAGDLTRLNLASMADASCFQTCSWTRTVLSVVAASRTWTGTVSAPAGMVVTIAPASTFTLPARSARAFTVTVNVSALAKDQWHFAAVTWSDGPGNSPDLRMPIAVFAQGSTDTLTLSKTVDTAVTSPGARLNYTIRVSNRSSSPRTFTVVDRIPAHTTYIPGSATGGLTYNPGTNTLTGTTGLLARLQPSVAASPSPFGYVPPAGLVGTFNMCALFTQCHNSIVNLSGVDFRYLGVRYTTVRIGTNGYIQPGLPPIGAQLPNQNLPNPADPDLVIAPFWSNLDMNGTSATDPGGGFFYFGDFSDPSTGDPYLVLGWEDAQLFGDPAQSYSFQIWIKEGTDQMWFVYQEINGSLPVGPDGGLTVGVENADGSAGMSRFYRPMGSCAPTCGSDVGIPPAVGTDLRVNSLAATATFTFAVTVDPTAPPGTHIQNLVEATDSVQTYVAVADSIVSLPAVGIIVTPTSGLTTTEAGGTAQFTVALVSAPTAPVTIALSSDDPSEGTVDPPSLTFDASDFATAKTVTVTGVDDLLDDGDVVYHVVTAPAVSADTRYAGLDPSDVTLTNLDDDGGGVLITPTSGLTTTEAGGTAQFSVVLTSQPKSTVTVNFVSSDTTEGTVPASVSFDSGDWNVPKLVTVTGVNDLFADGDVPYTIVTSVTSADPVYAAQNPPDVSLTNLDDVVEGTFYTITPCRLLDTRLTGGPLPSGFPIEVLLRSHCGIAATAKAVAINVTVVDATAVGSLVVYPFAPAPPGTNSVSFRAVRARAASSVLGLDATGRLGASANIPGGGSVHLLIDVSGYFE